MNPTPTFEDVLDLVQLLSPAEKLRLIQRIATQIDPRLIIEDPHPRQSALGALSDLGPAPSADEIDAARQEAWSNFPRERS